MAADAATRPLSVAAPRRAQLAAALAMFRPTWSVTAAYRALRATLVMPLLFAFSIEAVHNLQMATYAAFGSFATLVLATFSGSRRDKAVAHLLFAIVGTVLIATGTAVNATTWLAAIVTLVVAFVVLFGGAVGPNAATGATAVLLGYVLPAASPGAISTIPSRLAGWWLASLAGTLAVLVLTPPPSANRLRGACADSADALATELHVASRGEHRPADSEATIAAKHELIQSFITVPNRPTGLALADQALARLVEVLQWCTTLVNDLIRERDDLSSVAEPDRRLLEQSTQMLRETAQLMRGAPVEAQLADPGDEGRIARVVGLCEEGRDAEALHVAFHTGTIAFSARAAAIDALVAAGRAGSEAAAQLEDHFDDLAPPTTSTRPRWLAATEGLLAGNTSLRSVWLRNSLRGALALAAAVAVADLSDVQHGFWVVLGTLSVLRTNAAATGATALRALGGTAGGFFIGGALILAIGSHPAALWAALPIAVFVAAYAPGTEPFLVGQAAFTVTISVLYNILVPVGWKVGVLRLEDVALGAAVSTVVGAVLWPRGAGGVVGDDLADAYHRGGLYLVQATAWALGLRAERPDTALPAARAERRLDDALRGLLTEQGTRRIPKDGLWRLVGGASRLRETATGLSRLTRGDPAPLTTSRSLIEEAVRIAGRYDDLATRLGRTPVTVARELAALELGGGEASLDGQRGFALWVQLHLDHVQRNLADLFEPASEVATQRALPWWR